MVLLAYENSYSNACGHLDGIYCVGNMVTDYNAEMLSYFDRTPYKTEYFDDGDGGTKMVRVACDPPTVDGFCAKIGVPMEKLEKYIDPDTASLCLSKFKDIMITNGVQGLYESGPWSLTMKNLARWADKSEVTQTRVAVEIGLEEADRIIRFMRERALRAVKISDSQHDQGQGRQEPVIIDA